MANALARLNATVTRLRRVRVSPEVYGTVADAAVVLGGISDDTPIVPQAVAEAIVYEVSSFLGRAGHAPEAEILWKARRDIAQHVVTQAEQMYESNGRFYKNMQGGDTSLTFLYHHMRQWTAAAIKKAQPAIADTLWKSAGLRWTDFAKRGVELPGTKPPHKAPVKKPAPAPIDFGF